jgi:S1-C subfamily serine protease
LLHFEFEGGCLRNWLKQKDTADRLSAVLVAALLGLMLAPGGVHAADAQQIYAQSGPNIFQVLIIDKESQEKAAIGSGFAISDAGTEPTSLLATNFHVISEAVHEPEKYNVEYIAADGREGALDIVDFDVVHDLALVRMALSKEVGEAEADESASPPSPSPLPPGLEISAVAPEQGEQIFSLGNPFDLGQTIVPGTFNGLLEQSFYKKLLFSGSLNPGMSGGPALNQNGAVIGVNVATSGNQISFLVPVNYLQVLLNKQAERGAPLQVAQYQQELARQLDDDQAFKYQRLLEHDWQTQRLGAMQVGADLDEYFKCWGNTNDDEDLNFVSTMKSCTSQDTIYIRSRLTTGAIDIQYAWLTSDQLDSFRFHKVFGNNFAFMSTRTRADEDDVTNYQCHRDFYRPQGVGGHGKGGGVWRSVLCVRQYKAYRNLYDVLFQGSLLGQPAEDSGAVHGWPDSGHAGLASHFALTGVSHANAIAFVRKFMGLHAWDL